ncbi:hypothetical protein DPMN_049613 [Dreissena polymorpha]|uniref:Uncharacterized protein n=1 Tax=Dreissena polymorpha TaxID=45954 RepID=A0A9D4CFW7_DREPO|nr:hypothetical protein DPMN_049613 [Dreissena polymorpha]
MSSAEFLKSSFFHFFSKNTIRIANSLDPDETPRFVASHLDPNCLQRPSKSGSSAQRVNSNGLHTGQIAHRSGIGLSYYIYVYYQDPKDNKINQWHVAAAEVTSLGGVYIQHQVMSEAPVLGTWKLKAKLLSYEVSKHLH